MLSTCTARLQLMMMMMSPSVMPTARATDASQTLPLARHLPKKTKLQAQTLMAAIQTSVSVTGSES